MTLADHACGGAAAPTVPMGRDVITVESKVSFLSCAATRFQARGVFSAQNNAISDCSFERLALERLPISLTSLRSAAYSGLLRASGGGKRNCDGRVDPGRHGGNLRCRT